MLGKCEKVEVVHFGVVVCLPGAHRYLNEMHISKWPPRLKGYYREIKAMMQQNNLMFGCGDRFKFRLNLNLNLNFAFTFKSNFNLRHREKTPPPNSICVYTAKCLV